MKPDTEPTGIPLVLIHGFGAGVALWALNLDALSNNNRKLYAFDVLGFGRSSRPDFTYSEQVEWQLTESIERWRAAVGLNEKFILLGHSFGGYLALSYALQYPDRVAHIILADPWGMPSQQQAIQNRPPTQYSLPMWAKLVGLLVQKFNPLAGLRLAGPWGLKLIQKIRSDIKGKFECLMGSKNADYILQYIYHCNVQPNPSGEMAFRALALPFGWAKFPMINRISDIDPGPTITFIYGSRSWIERQTAFQIKYLLGDSRVDVHVIQGAGHHVYADKSAEFNNLINEICLNIDETQNRE
jgi:abhydrolase domain-containing protein, putative